MSRPMHVVGLGRTVRAGSSSEQALRIVLARAAAQGATTRVFAGAELAQLPMYAPDAGDRGPVARDLVAHLRRADGVIVASPGYDQLDTVADEVVRFADLVGVRRHQVLSGPQPAER